MWKENVLPGVENATWQSSARDARGPWHWAPLHATEELLGTLPLAWISFEHFFLQQSPAPL